MKHAQPLHLSRTRVERLLSQTKFCRSAGSRVDILSRQFLGRPYESNLIGSAGKPEVFTASLNAFDCVTYIETSLALALASNVTEFIQWLRKIRYKNGDVAWEHRNHYMTGWIRNNVRVGALKRVSVRGLPGVVKERTLDCVPGLAPVEARFSCVPKAEIGKFGRRLQSGDLIFFASTRNHLDVFHCGIVVRDGGGVLLRHAARSRGAVVEQELKEFLKANRMAGVIVVRPR
jgi:hypothetical protein